MLENNSAGENINSDSRNDSLSHAPLATADYAVGDKEASARRDALFSFYARHENAKSRSKKR